MGRVLRLDQPQEYNPIWKIGNAMYPMDENAHTCHRNANGRVVCHAVALGGPATGERRAMWPTIGAPTEVDLQRIKVRAYVLSHTTPRCGPVGPWTPPQGTKSVVP